MVEPGDDAEKPAEAVVEQPVEEMKKVEVVAPELPKITTADEWRRRAKATFRLHLRTSNVWIKVRKPDWSRLVEDGVISDEELLNAVVATPGSGQQVVRIGIERARRVVPHIVVEPRIVYPNGHGGADLAEDVLSVEDVSRDDLLVIMGWAMVGVPEAVEITE